MNYKDHLKLFRDTKTLEGSTIVLFNCIIIDLDAILNNYKYFSEAVKVLNKIIRFKKKSQDLVVHLIYSKSSKYSINDLLTKIDNIAIFVIHTRCQDKYTIIKKIVGKIKLKDKTVIITSLYKDIKKIRQIDGIKIIALERKQNIKKKLKCYFPDYFIKNLNEIFNLKSYSKKLREEEYNKENPFTSYKVSKEWTTSVEGEKGLWRDKILYPTIRLWFNTFNKRDAVILDVGSGQGRLSAELDGYKKYIGVEPSIFLTNRAKKLYLSRKRNFLIGNAYEIPLENNSVDGVISINVFFHLANLDKAIQELARVLKNNGRFFINTADNDSIEAWKSFYINPKFDDKKMYGEVKVPITNMSLNTFYYHPNNEMIAKLEKNGLKITEITKSFELNGQTLFIIVSGIKK